MKYENKVNYSKERLNQQIIKSIQEKKLSWTEIAKKHDVSFQYVQSVNSTHRVQTQSENIAKGNLHHSYRGCRMTDGKPSPVKTYNIRDLTPEERKKLKLE